jgi:hypothetical protein
MGVFQGVVRGTVRESSTGALLYSVLYSDGDAEDLSLGELRAVLA